MFAVELLLTLAVSFAEPSDVAWLAEVTRPPASIAHDDAFPIAPLLKTADGREITTSVDWLQRRTELLRAWTDLLGPMPERPKSSFEELASEELAKCVRKRIRYECEAGLFVEAYLLIPLAPGRHPGVVALHQTTGNTIDQIAGVAGPDEQQLGLKLAERGFVVICPRCFLWENTSSLPAAVETFRRRHPGVLGMKKMLHDAMRAVDLLEHVPQCDPRRIGSIGHSLGAKEVLYLAAFDERVKASVASEGGLTFRSTNWDAAWYLGEGLRRPGFARNHHELLALAAPRPLLLIGGEKGSGAADGLRSWELIAAAQPVYRLSHETVRLGLLNQGKGHSIPPDVFEKSVEWLRTYLGPED